MKIKPFLVEEWMNEYEDDAVYNIAETCVDSVSLDELFELTGEDRDTFWNNIAARRLTYGDITGKLSFKEGVCKLYRTMKPEEIIPTHGAAGANHHVFYSLVEPGDRIISIMPTYQQLYSIPESYGADLQLLHLTADNGYLPDLDELKKLATPGTRMICINNPNNPTGALLSKEQLLDIIEVAREVGAYVVCDEVYRHLTHQDEWCESVADLYEKGISVGSMSKVFSLAGLRLGWIATHDEEAHRAFMSHRDYNLISCGIFDEAIADIALRHVDKVLERSRNIIRTNIEIVDEWVNGEEHVSYMRPQAGTTALIFYDIDMDSYEFAKKLIREYGVLVTPGDCFEVPKSFRLGYAYETEALREGLEKVSELLRERVPATQKVHSDTVSEGE